MSRPILRTLKSLYSSSKIPARISRRSTTLEVGDQTVVLHKVKFANKPRLARRINRLVLSGLGLSIFGGLLLDLQLIKDGFIPFPLTTRQLDPQPYSGRDPEWQEFIRIAKDKALQGKIRQDLVNLVLQHAKASQVLTARCGDDMKIRRYWMDLDYPYVAPPEYEISGLRFTADAIEWTSRPMESLTVRLLERVFWPRPITLSFWTLGTAILKQKISDVARYFGLEASDSSSQPSPDSNGPGPLPESHNTPMRKAIERMREQATKRPDEVNDPSSMALNTPSPTEKPSGSAGKVPSGTDNAQSARQKFWGEDQVRSAVSLSPWQVFMKKYAQTWKPIRPEPPRGCVAASGLVELETPKSWIVIDVYGWYNPKTGSFDEKTVWMGLRRLQHKQQSPLR